MAKRASGLGDNNKKRTHSYKTKKRLEIKYERLAALAKKRGSKRK